MTARTSCNMHFCNYFMSASQPASVVELLFSEFCWICRLWGGRTCITLLIYIYLDVYILHLNVLVQLNIEKFACAAKN